MIKKWNAAVLLVFGMISSGAFALDLTPHEIAASGDGPSIKRFFFQDEDKRVSFRIDSKMTVSGTSAVAAFRFEDINTAGVTLSKSQMKPAAPFDEKNLESYRVAARTFFPPNATNIQLDEEKPDAIAINGWTSRQFVFSYNLFGAPYRRSITFVNYSQTEQIVLDIGAAAPDYEKTYLRGYRVLNSLTDLTTASSSGPT
jgi:hypothetical protein